MAAVGTGDLYRVVMYSRCDGQTGLMISHWEVVATATGGATQKEVADQLSAAIAPLLKAWESDSAAYWGLTLQRIKPIPLPDAVPSVAGQGDCANTGDRLPIQCAAVISLRTGFAGRKNRGRKYVPFGTESSNTADLINAAGLILLAPIRDFFLTNFAVTGATGNSTLANVIYHKATNDATAIVTGFINQPWGTQRRRSRINRGDQLPPF